MANHLNMSEEDADAEIERMQQKLTLALQHIDENFAACNQNASKLSAEIDRYGEASQDMRNNSQVKYKPSPFSFFFYMGAFPNEGGFFFIEMALFPSNHD